MSVLLGALKRQMVCATVGSSRDVLLGHIREVNQVMKELEMYSHHVTLLAKMCHRLVRITFKHFRQEVGTN